VDIHYVYVLQNAFQNFAQKTAAKHGCGLEVTQPAYFLHLGWGQENRYPFFTV
jgi:hypothetical protein